MTEPKEAQTTPKKKGDLLPRVMTSVVMLPLLIWLINWGPHWGWGLFILAAAAIGLHEFYGMVQRDEPKSVPLVSTLISLAGMLTIYLFVGRHPMVDLGEHQTTALFAFLALLLWGSFLFNTLRPREIPRAAQTMSGALAGFVYVGLTFTFVALIRRDLGEFGPGWVFLLLAMVWMSDTGAYFTGRAFGKRKLAPIVSPKKSVEGALGGLASTLIGAFLISAAFLPFLGPLDVLLLALVANPLAQCGDLCESLLKRSTGIKDSGTIIPGHGGVLDRFDAVLFVAPWVYLFGLFVDGSSLFH